jgi:hypothetical protein
MNCLKTLVKRRNITSPKLKVDILKVLHLATANRSVILLLPLLRSHPDVSEIANINLQCNNLNQSTE